MTLPRPVLLALLDQKPWYQTKQIIQFLRTWLKQSRLGPRAGNGSIILILFHEFLERLNQDATTF